MTQKLGQNLFHKSGQMKYIYVVL